MSRLIDTTTEENVEPMGIYWTTKYPLVRHCCVSDFEANHEGCNSRKLQFRVQIQMLNKLEWVSFAGRLSNSTSQIILLQIILSQMNRGDQTFFFWLQQVCF